MEKGVISFRPSPEVREWTEKVKAEGQNVSKQINEKILLGMKAKEEEERPYRMCFRFIPEGYQTSGDNGEYEQGWWLSGAYKEDYAVEIMKNTVPISHLSLRTYDRFKKCLERSGFQFFSTKVQDFGVVQMVAINSDMANVEFQKYFTRTADGKYIRTALPLPVLRYDVRTDTAAIYYAEPL
jgi:hypothetical protein